MSYTMLEQGKVNEEFIGMAEGISADLTDEGILILDTRERVTLEEAENFGKAVQFKTAVIDGFTFLFVKMGSLNWTDMPVQLTGKMNENIKDGLGYAVNLICADTATGIVIVNRLIGFSTAFSKQLNKNLKETGGFEPIESHLERVRKIQRKYSTKEALKFANGQYKTE